MIDKPVPAIVTVSAAKQSDDDRGSAGTALSALKHRHSVAHRWAVYVLKGSLAGDDLKTLRDWARHVGVGYTALCETCRLLHTAPRDARDLSRALGAMLNSTHEKCAPTALLDISDLRTLRAFVKRAGPAFRPGGDLDAIDRFLDTQQFVAPENPGVRIVRQLLRDELVADAANGDGSRVLALRTE